MKPENAIESDPAALSEKDLDQVSGGSGLWARIKDAFEHLSHHESGPLPEQNAPMPISQPIAVAPRESPLPTGDRPSGPGTTAGATVKTSTIGAGDKPVGRDSKPLHGEEVRRTVSNHA